MTNDETCHRCGGRLTRVVSIFHDGETPDLTCPCWPHDWASTAVALSLIAIVGTIVGAISCLVMP